MVSDAGVCRGVVFRFPVLEAQPLLQKWLSTLFMRPYTVWGQMPEDSDQLKREKLELGSSLLQLLKEIAQRCPAALLEVMVRDGHGQDAFECPFAVSDLEGDGRGCCCTCRVELLLLMSFTTRFCSVQLVSFVFEGASEERIFENDRAG